MGLAVVSLPRPRYPALPCSWPGPGVADQRDLAAGDDLFYLGAGEGLGHAGPVGGDVVIPLVADIAHLGRVEGGVFDDHPCAGPQPFEELDEALLLLLGGDGVAASAARRPSRGFQPQVE